jgi:hypothetical protein
MTEAISVIEDAPIAPHEIDLDQVEAYMLTLPQVECPIRHHFAPGVYAREMTAFAGSFIVGKIHKQTHLIFFLQGSGYIATDSGPEYFTAPYTTVTPAGTKRAIYAKTDIIWTAIHPTDKTDLAEIEAEVIATSYDELDEHLGIVEQG